MWYRQNYTDSQNKDNMSYLPHSELQKNKTPKQWHNCFFSQSTPQSLYVIYTLNGSIKENTTCFAKKQTFIQRC